MSRGPADASTRVLILGAYSAIGQEITAGLLDQVECAVVATGRDQHKLDRMSGGLPHPRVSFSRLDAQDEAALRDACQDADIVVNCVGPYIISGYDVAATVVRAARHYVDFAFEQFHFNRLRTLDALARANEVTLVTGAGEVVGLSSILCAHAAEALPDVDTLVICALEGKSQHGDDGFSSLMNGALEPALDNQDYLDGRYVRSRMGADLALRSFPEPYGTTQLISDPTIDSLILPGRCGARTIRNYFGMGVPAPPGFFTLMRLLNPYRHRVLYRLTSAIVRQLMRNSEERKTRAGVPVAQLLRVDAESAERLMTIELSSRGGRNLTACLPILICGMLVRGEIHERGLRTALDLVTPARLFHELERYRQQGNLGWTITGPSPRCQDGASCASAQSATRLSSARAADTRFEEALMPTNLPASTASPWRSAGRPPSDAPDVEIRMATRADDDAIGSLFARCPEAGAVTLGYRLVGRVGALRGRFPTTRIHLACSSGGVVVGMLVSDVGSVLIAGRGARGARLSFLRIDPSFRRRGIARALLRRAEADARSLDGAEVFWGHVFDGNRASHAMLAGAGYLRGPSGSYKLVDPRRCAAPPLGSRVRTARAADLPWLVSALNDRYGGYDFWQPFTATEYGQTLERWIETGGTPRLWILAGTDDTPLAAALCYRNGHALVVEKVSPWLRLVNTVIRLPIGIGMPLRITTVADIVVDPSAPKDAGAAVTRHAIQDQRDSADFVILMRHANEPGDLAHRSVTGVSVAADVIYKGSVLAERPSYIEPW